MSKDTMPDNLDSFRQAFSKNAKEFDALVVAMFEHVESAMDAHQKKYQELIFAVAQKFPNETRHETALRYINERENQCHGPVKAILHAGDDDE